MNNTYNKWFNNLLNEALTEKANSKDLLEDILLEAKKWEPLSMNYDDAVAWRVPKASYYKDDSLGGAPNLDGTRPGVKRIFDELTSSNPADVERGKQRLKNEASIIDGSAPHPMEGRMGKILRKQAENLQQIANERDGLTWALSQGDLSEDTLDAILRYWRNPFKASEQDKLIWAQAKENIDFWMRKATVMTREPVKGKITAYNKPDTIEGTDGTQNTADGGNTGGRDPGEFISVDWAKLRVRAESYYNEGKEREYGTSMGVIDIAASAGNLKLYPSAAMAIKDYLETEGHSTCAEIFKAMKKGDSLYEVCEGIRKTLGITPGTKWRYAMPEEFDNAEYVKQERSTVIKGTDSKTKVSDLR